MTAIGPNILLIMTDEQRFDAVGYVNPAVKTPHLDALSRESVTLTRAYATNPSCVPARAAIMTGRYPSQCGAPTFITHLPDTETTFMALLQQAGYHTAVIGKQHFGSSRVFRGYHHEDIVDMHSPPAVIRDASPAAPSYVRFLADQGIREPRRMLERETRFSYRWTADIRYHVDHFVGERGKEWLRVKRPAGQPWFLCVSFPGPHQPFDCSGTPQAARYSLETIDLPRTSQQALAGKPPHFRLHKTISATGLAEDELRRIRRAYYANVTLIDDKIGEMLDVLRETGEYENTLIIYTSDHGDFMGDFGLMYKGQYLSEVLMRVPLVVKPPLLGFRGRREPGLVSTVDIAATCLTAAGVQVPDTMASRDLSPYWVSPGTVSRPEHLYMEAGGLRGIRTEEWKLVHYHGRPYGELYCLADDPWETTNLWDDPGLADVKVSLRSLMIDCLVELGTRSAAAWNHGAPDIVKSVPGGTNHAAAADLPADAPEVNAKKIQPREFGDVVAFLCSMPAHPAVEQMIVWPLIQQVEPL